MKKINRFYLKLFLIYGLTFGLLMTLWDYVDEGEIDIIKLIFMTVFFGGFMSWTTIKNLKKTKIKANGKIELTEEDFKATQKKYIPKILTLDSAFERLKKYDVKNSWHLKINNSRIEGKTKASWISWGEKIIISFLNDKIEIKSKPRVKIQMIDTGNNRQNVEQISLILNEE
jgi:hypothetical protein